jgi:hypothetical protein
MRTCSSPLHPQDADRLGGKVQRGHLERLAVVYVRQSTMQQVDGHQESTRLQYALVDRALALGCVFRRFRPPVPAEAGRPFQGKAATSRSEATRGSALLLG